MRRLVAATLTLVVAAGVARADTPLILSHSGYLLDGMDRPVNRDDVSIGLSVWTDPMAVGTTSRVWPETGETKCTAKVFNGYYGVVLDGTQTTGCGAGLVAEVLSTTELRYLQVSVNGTPLLPRVRLTAAPIASMALKANDAAALGGRAPSDYASAVHAHTAAEVTDFDEKAAAAVSAHGLAWDRVTGVSAETAWPGTAEWERVASKPERFPPASHAHLLAEISDVTPSTEWPGRSAWARLDGKPATFPPATHTHTLAQLSDVTATTAWPGTSEWARVGNRPATFPPSAHTHAATELTGLPAALAGANVPGSLFIATSVGIGTTTAAAPLDVRGNARFTGAVEQNGRHDLVVNGNSTGKDEWTAEFSITPGHAFAEIVAVFNHAGGGQHWAYRRFEALFNANTDIRVLRDFETGGNSYGGVGTALNGAWVLARPSGGRFTLTKTAGTDPYPGPVNIWISSNAPVALVSKTN